MLKRIVLAASMATALSLSLLAQATPITEFTGQFEFSGVGINGNGTITVVPNVSPTDPNPLCGTPGNNACRSDPPGAYRVISISGSVSDPSLGLSNATITGLVPTNPANERDPTFDPLVPTSLSFVGSATDPSQYFSYDNLFYPDGAPIVCAFPFTGTSIDPFGLAFTIAGGDTVALWGDGNYGSGAPPGGYLTYGVGILSYDSGSGTYTKLVNQFNGVKAHFDVPEPASGWLFAAGLALLAVSSTGASSLLRRRRRTAALAASPRHEDRGPMVDTQEIEGHAKKT